PQSSSGRVLRSGPRPVSVGAGAVSGAGARACPGVGTAAGEQRRVQLPLPLVHAVPHVVGEVAHRVEQMAAGVAGRRGQAARGVGGRPPRERPEHPRPDRQPGTQPEPPLHSVHPSVPRPAGTTAARPTVARRYSRPPPPGHRRRRPQRRRRAPPGVSPSPCARRAAARLTPYPKAATLTSGLVATDDTTCTRPATLPATDSACAVMASTRRTCVLIPSSDSRT